jgi:spore coat protein A
VIQDRFFNPDGSLLYPTQTPGAGGDPDTRVPPIWIGVFGDTVLVNGKVWPFLEVERAATGSACSMPQTPGFII